MLTLFLTAALMAAPQAKPAQNTACPACGGKVDTKSPTVEVRGKAYAVCCSGCGDMVKKNPDKYLEKDGTPKNAKK